MYPYSDAYKASAGYQSTAVPPSHPASYRPEVRAWPAAGGQVPYGQSGSSHYAQPAVHAAPQHPSTIYSTSAPHPYPPSAPSVPVGSLYPPYQATTDSSRGVVDRSHEIPALSPERPTYSSKRSDDDALYPRASKSARVDEEDEFLYSSSSRRSREREEEDQYYRKSQYQESRESSRKRSPSPIPGLTREQHSILLKTLDVVTKRSPSAKEKITEDGDKYDTCVYLGLDNCHPDFHAVQKLRGDRDENLTYLRRASEARIEVRGEGTIYARNKPCHLYIGHSTLKGMQEAEKLATSLVQVIQREYREFTEKRRGLTSRGPSASEPPPRSSSPIRERYYSPPPKARAPSPEKIYEPAYKPAYPTSYQPSYPPSASSGQSLDYPAYPKKKKVPTATLR